MGDSVGPDARTADATALAAPLGRREWTALELVDAAIARIEADDGICNAVIHRRFEEARREAVGPLPDGPFRGVPMCVKDAVCATAGDPYHLGMRALRD